MNIYLPLIKHLLLSFFVTSTLLPSSNSCPSKCSCYDDTVDCSNKFLNEVPQGIPKTTKKLYLGGNFITDIKKETFSGYVSLTTLGLSSNMIKTIDNDAFRDLRSLVTLSLRENQLSVITKELFQNLGNLTILMASYAAKEGTSLCIEDGAFTNLSKLNILKLDSNNLLGLTNHTFDGLRTGALQQLDLSSNSFQLLEPGSFTGMGTTLITLYDILPCCCSSMHAMERVTYKSKNCIADVNNNLQEADSCSDVLDICRDVVVSSCRIIDVDYVSTSSVQSLSSSSKSHTVPTQVESSSYQTVFSSATSTLMSIQSTSSTIRTLSSSAERLIMNTTSLSILTSSLSTTSNVHDLNNSNSVSSASYLGPNSKFNSSFSSISYSHAKTTQFTPTGFSTQNVTTPSIQSDGTIVPTLSSEFRDFQTFPLNKNNQSNSTCICSLNTCNYCSTFYISNISTMYSHFDPSYSLSKGTFLAQTSSLYSNRTNTFSNKQFNSTFFQAPSNQTQVHNSSTISTSLLLKTTKSFSKYIYKTGSKFETQHTEKSKTTRLFFDRSGLETGKTTVSNNSATSRNKELSEYSITKSFFKTTGLDYHISSTNYYLVPLNDKNDKSSKNYTDSTAWLTAPLQNSSVSLTVKSKSYEINAKYSSQKTIGNISSTRRREISNCHTVVIGHTVSCIESSQNLSREPIKPSHIFIIAISIVLLLFLLLLLLRYRHLQNKARASAMFSQHSVPHNRAKYVVTGQSTGSKGIYNLGYQKEEDNQQSTTSMTNF